MPTESFSSAESEGNTTILSTVRVCFSVQEYTETQLEKIAKLPSFKTEREIPISKSPGGRDFGYDFPKCSSYNTILILAVSTSASPICYDFGGGFGGSSLNMVLAGGKVTYIEHHPDVAATAAQKFTEPLRTFLSTLNRKMNSGVAFV